MGRIDYSELRKMLAAREITSYTFRKNGRIGQGTWKKIQAGEPISTSTIAVLCEILDCQPGDFMRYVSDAEEAAKRSDADG